MNDLAQQAITCALNLEWNTAKDLNLQILKKDSQDLAALNRLAKAYSELGDNKKAIQTAKKVLSLDQYNKIALRSLEKWQHLGKTNTKASGPFSATEFIEEPGKTKLVTLLHLGDQKIVANLDAGDEVKLVNHGHRIAVEASNKYIGRLPDDLSLRLKKLIAHGNEYRVIIKSTEKGEIKVFIKEAFRAAKIKDVPSFSPEKIDYIAFTPPGLVHKNKVETADMDSEE